jgi:hypothetical protein
MLLYITATTQVISEALVVERDKPNKVLKVQWPVYFVSEALFRRTPYHGGFEIPAQRGDPEPGGRREDF